MQPYYNVPVIPQNLRKEETIIQIAESLKYLSDVSNDIFKRINDRVESNNNSLLRITDRISTVNSKITKLTGATKTIQVFSSCKYPATDVNRKYKTIFTDKDRPKFTKFNTKYKDVPVKDEPLETLQFYHVKVVDVNENNYDGLGEIPKDIETVNDLLLYNSGKNPYSKYVMSDTLQLLQTSKKEDLAEGPEIGAAPLSISDRKALTKTAGENYFYSPNLGDVPTLDVPLDLPDLPGIADDLRYIDGAGPGIAPSVTTTPNVPDLPEIITINEHSEMEFVNHGEVQVPIFTVPPKPPEPIRIEQEVVIIKSKQEPVVQQTQVPLQETTEDEPKEAKADREIKTEGPSGVPSKPDFDGNTAHASLMEAIRNAGGLKKAKLRSAEPKTVAKGIPSGGDLMADLHAKLSMRRKGLSGAKASNGIDEGSAMDKVSAMIPPPPISEQSESGTTDDDWEED